MPLSMGEKIKIVLGRRNMTLAQLAEATGQSRQNMSNKMSRDNFSEKSFTPLLKLLTALFRLLSR